MAFQAGAIVSKLTLDRSKFSASMKAVQKQTKALGGWVKKNSGQFKAMGIAAVAAGTAALLIFKKMVKQYVEVGDMVHKMALRTGFAAETLSELAYAADISGADLTMLEKGVKKMSKTIVDASYGLETYLRVFRSLGLDVEDLMKLTPEEQFLKIGAAIAGMENQTLKTAAAVDVLGRAGTMLLPLFAEGAEGIAKLREEAHRLGIIFDEEAAVKAAKLKDAQTALKGSIQGVSIAILNDLIPVITDVVKGFTDWFVKSREDAGNWTHAILGFFSFIAQGIQGLALAWGTFKVTIFKMGEEIVRHLARLTLGIVVVTGYTKKMGILSKTHDAAKEALKDLVTVGMGYNKSAEDQIDTMTDLIVKYEAFVATLDKIKTKTKEAKEETKSFGTVLEDSTLPAVTDMSGVLEAAVPKMDSYIFATKGMTESQKEFSTLMIGALVTMETSLKGFVDAILGTFERWALGQIIPKIMAALPFPFNLLATAGAIATIKTIFKSIRGMAEGGWVGLHGEEIIKVGERGPEYVSSNETITNVLGGGEARVNFNFYAPLIETTGIASNDLERISEELFRKMERQAKKRGYKLNG